MVQAIRSQIPASSAMVSLANLVQKKKTFGGGAKDSNSRPLTMPSPALRFQQTATLPLSLVVVAALLLSTPFKKEAKDNY